MSATTILLEVHKLNDVSDHLRSLAGQHPVVSKGSSPSRHTFATAPLYWKSCPRRKCRTQLWKTTLPDLEKTYDVTLEGFGDALALTVAYKWRETDDAGENDGEELTATQPRKWAGERHVPGDSDEQSRPCQH